MTRVPSLEDMNQEEELGVALEHEISAAGGSLEACLEACESDLIANVEWGRETTP